MGGNTYGEGEAFGGGIDIGGVSDGTVESERGVDGGDKVRCGPAWILEAGDNHYI